MVKKQTKVKKTNKKTSKKAGKIHKKMTFAQLLETDKEAAMKLAEKGMFCCGCPMALTETIEQGASAHGMDAEKLVDELNEK